jgi:hypothetical protein
MSGSYFVKKTLINRHFKLKIQITYIYPLWYDVGDLHLLYGKQIPKPDRTNLRLPAGIV